MKTIDQIQDEIVGEFELMGDGFDQYSYLVELACILQPIPDELKTDDRRVEGCQSRVWLEMGTDEQGMFEFAADSDTLIVKGVLYLLKRVFNGQTCADVAAAKINFFERTEISATFDDDRQKGIGYVIASLQRKAAELS